MVEQLPLAENRIVPDDRHRDAIGLPRPRITYRIDDYCRRALDHGQRIHQEIFAAMNATAIEHGSTIYSAGHVMGTYRMGTDPKTSVVSPEQRTHDHHNLFLLGSGVFPDGCRLESHADDCRSGAACCRCDSASGSGLTAASHFSPIQLDMALGLASKFVLSPCPKLRHWNQD